MSSSAPAVWAYWEDVPGTSRAGYLDLCIETIRYHAPPLEVRLLSSDEVQTWLPDIDVERWRRLPAPNFRSDYLRSRLLQRYGGIWIDVDTIAMGPLSALLSELDGSGFLGWGRELEGRCYTNLVAAIPGAAFIDAWVDQQDKLLSRFTDWSKLPYAALAQDITWDLARRRLPWKSLPIARVAPVLWDEWRRFLSQVDSPRSVLAGAPLAIVLWNAAMGPALSGRSRTQLLASRILLSRLLRTSLAMSNPLDEEDGWTKWHILSDARFSRYGRATEAALRRILERRAGRDG